MIFKIAITLILIGLPTALIAFNLFGNVPEPGEEDVFNKADYIGIAGAYLFFIGLFLILVDTIANVWSI